MQQQFMDKGKTVVFDDVDNPHEVYELRHLSQAC